MKFYEVVFILRPDIQSQEVESKIAPFINMIENNGGSLALREEWGLMGLRYEVRKNRKGIYVMLVFGVEGGESEGVLSEIESHCKLSEDVIRYLIVKVDEPKGSASPIMEAQKAKAAASAKKFG